MRNFVMSFLLVGASLLGSTVFAQELVEGRNFITLASPVPTAQPEKIEVVELFWYGCPHCYQLESTINPWAAALPEVQSIKLEPTAAAATVQATPGNVNK